MWNKKVFRVFQLITHQRNIIIKFDIVVYIIILLIAINYSRLFFNQSIIIVSINKLNEMTCQVVRKAFLMWKILQQKNEKFWYEVLGQLNWENISTKEKILNKSSTYKWLLNKRLKFHSNNIASLFTKRYLATRRHLP